MQKSELNDIGIALRNAKSLEQRRMIFVRVESSLLLERAPGQTLHELFEILTPDAVDPLVKHLSMSSHAELAIAARDAAARRLAEDDDE